jgi:chromosome segregation and condensation protein ScpB
MPEGARWHIWMTRIEAVIFASPCDAGNTGAPRWERMRARRYFRGYRTGPESPPYELAFVTSGYQIRTKALYADAIRASEVQGSQQRLPDLSQAEMMVLADTAYFQPITRAAISDHLGKEISRDIIAKLKQLDSISAGPRVPEPGAPYAYVTTRHFLSLFGLNNLRDLPDLDQLSEDGLLNDEEHEGQSMLRTDSDKQT